MKRIWKSMILVTVSAAAGGCPRTVTKSTKVSVAERPVAREASEEELLDRYNALARGLKSIDATLELKPTAGTKYSGVIDEYHEVKAFLLASRPYNIRMIGQVPVVGKTVFDMVSDGQTFEVSIPPKNKFLTGQVALERQSSKPIENLRPQHLVDAVLWPEVRKEEVVLIEEYNDENARYYVLTVLRGGYKSEILRKVWFDRADLRVVRLQAYGPKGALLSDVRYANWQPVATGGAEEYPMSIRIDRPRDEYRLDLNISKIALNETLEADRFKLEAPAGADVVHVGENSEGKRP
jgi:outer membrane lipoprotein-sorting protein